MFNPKQISHFPTKPGVYLMKGRKGSVLYVGKAKNLRDRVKQYFIPGRDPRPMVPLLVAKVHSVETIVVSSEKEALLLENNLIKKYKPRYNILLKDDKTYIALKINNKHSWPRLQLIRYRGQPKPDGLYFGPYTSAYAARQTLDLMQKIFPMRQCSDQELARRTRPCILYDMKRCVAPCVNRCTHDEYDHYVQSAIKFLRGQDKEVLKDLYAQMEQCSEALEFERAAAIHKTIQQIETTIEKQTVDQPLGVDTDVLGIFRQGDELVLSQIIYRGGKLTGSRNYNFSQILQNNREVLQTFLLQHYSNYAELPKQILLSESIDDKTAVEELLAEGRLKIITPVKGVKQQIVELALKNAEATFRREKDEAQIRERTLLEMQEKLKLIRYPDRIECFDNSHLSGSYAVSALVAYTNGEKDGSRYRKYKLKSVDPSDDYGAMREVLTRRYKRGKEEDNLPDLVIIDGGKGHLNIAIKVFEELDIASVDLIGVAKEEGRHDKGVTAEQVFLPNRKDPIHLTRHSSILFLLQQIRDEAHRSAISYSRNVHKKSTIGTALTQIPGIGPAKSKRLLKHFGSVKAIKEATLSQIEAVKGISQKDATLIKKGLK